MLTDEEVRKNAEVKETYRKMHSFQTVDFVRQKVLQYVKSTGKSRIRDVPVL